MRVDTDFGDLIYVSQLKVERMHRTLQLPPWKHVTGAGLGVHLAGVGGLRVDLATRQEDLVARLRHVTDAIYRKYAVRQYDDPQLREGRWFVGQMPDMAYGWGKWDHCREDGPVTFFTGHHEGRRTQLVLGGSLQHMLDRELPNLGARTGSTTERFREVMAKIIAVEEQGRDPGLVPPIRIAGSGSQGLEEVARASAGCIDAFLADNGGRNSLIFMARAIDVFEPTEGVSPYRLITGTPLYVGIWDDEARDAIQAEPEPRSSMLARFRKSLSGGRVEPVRERLVLCRPAVSDTPPYDRGPSLDVELYVRPSSAASYASPSDYYDASPLVQRGSIDVAVGDNDFSSSDRYWFDERDGAWLVSFSMYGSPLLALGPDTRGDVVATSVGSERTLEVLVLIADVRFHDVESSLEGYACVEPRLKWMVDHLPHHAARSGEAEQ